MLFKSCSNWLTRHLLYASLIRIALLMYSEWHDQRFLVKYTDIDYHVFSDAASYVARGKSPYLRSTFRYTPLLAWLLVANVVVHPAIGKLIFVLGDVFAGYLIHRLLVSYGTSKSRTRFAMAVWLYNPLTMVISTRGSAESIVTCMVLGTLHLLQIKQTVWAGVMYGLAIHFKLYPVTYCLPLYFSQVPEKDAKECEFGESTRFKKKWNANENLKLDDVLGAGDTLQCHDSCCKENSLEFGKTDVDICRSRFATKDVSSSGYISNCSSIGRDDASDQLSRSEESNELKQKNCTLWRTNLHYYIWPNTERLQFVTACVLTLFSLSAFWYSIYGDEFVQESLLYHVYRKDTRHNFSVYFYMLYLTSEWDRPLVLSFVTFLPQAVLLVALAFRFHRREDLPFCLFAQTYVFVTLNKVCTSQYFVWYISLLPLVLPRLKLTVGRVVGCAAIWLVGQAAWLFFAYQLEFKGHNTFLELWAVGLGFYAVNIAVLVQLIHYYQ